jgi:hypothetical protein
MLHTPYADMAFQNQTQAAGTFNSGPLANAGLASWCVLYANVSAASGTTHTLDVKLQGSNDSETWTDIAGAAITQITGTSNTATTSGPIPYDYVQAVATVGGTGTPSVTFAAAVVLF